MKLSPLVAVTAALALAGCAIMAVGSEHSPSADFNAYRTFGWEPGEIEPTGDARLDADLLFDAGVRDAVGHELLAKGLEAAAGGRPDLLVHYHFHVETKLEVYQLDEELGYAAYERQAAEYDEGTLVVGIADPRINRMVWRAWVKLDVTGVIDNPERLAERIREAVGAIFERYPPGTG